MENTSVAYQRNLSAKSLGDCHNSGLVHWAHTCLGQELACGHSAVVAQGGGLGLQNPVARHCVRDVWYLSELKVRHWCGWEVRCWSWFLLWHWSGFEVQCWYGLKVGGMFDLDISKSLCCTGRRYLLSSDCCWF